MPTAALVTMAAAKIMVIVNDWYKRRHNTMNPEPRAKGLGIESLTFLGLIICNII